MKVLVVDDEPAICDVITVSFGMRWPDVEVVCARTGRAGVVAARTSAPDLIILDLGLPDLDGFSLCLELAQLALAPIVILSVKNDEMDKVKGLELGADDYITKPFSHLELQARLQAILRRYDTSARDPAPPYEGSRLCIDFGSREINVDGELVKLTPIEYRLLSMLVQNVNRVVSHKDLLSEVWGKEYVDQVDYLKVHVRRLRGKIEEDPANPRSIVMERGVGYRFVEPGGQTPIDSGPRAG